MNSFSISQLQQFSGIKAHTIRMWEQRYQALTPSRSEGNTRYYDNTQLRRLLNIVSLLDGEHKVSELCAMPDALLFKELKKLTQKEPVNPENQYFISQLLVAGMSYDEVHFEKIFASSLLRLGLKNTYTDVIYPMLNRIGLMWSDNSIPPAQEHFISNILRQKIFTAVDGLPPANSTKDSWLLFLPENEFHEIGLLFAQYLIKQAGGKVTYLGSNVPMDTLAQAVKDTSPQNLLLFLVHNNIPENSQAYLNSLKKQFPSTQIHVSGNEKLIGQLKTRNAFKWIQSVAQLQEKL
ncbi:MAG: MerR family transcriptional regulator [Bacteroidota bacterium]